MLLSVMHKTRYGFSQGVTHGLQRLRLKPKSTQGQQILEWTMELEGATPQAEYEDQHHNHTVLVSIEPGTQEVVVTCRGVVDTRNNNGVNGTHSGHMPLWSFLRATALTKPGPHVRALAAELESGKSDTLGTLHALSRLVAERIKYVPGTSDAKTTAEQALGAGLGVCQDHAHVFIAASRLLDIPARYVGGYLKMDESDEQEAGHGWAEAHVQGLGWVGFDISNAICPDERYIRVATGCDYGEAAPITGIAVGAGETSLDVHLSVGQKMLGGQAQQQTSSDSSGTSQQQVQGG